MIEDKELISLEMTIEVNCFNKKEVKEKIYEFLKELNVITLDMEEK